jgi:hypothetical protein
MFYVCKRYDNGTFGVMDTEDGVIESYSPRDLIKIVKKFKVDIVGVDVMDNSKVRITVKKPVQLEDDVVYQATLDDIPTVNSGFGASSSIGNKLKFDYGADSDSGSSIATGKISDFPLFDQDFVWKQFKNLFVPTAVRIIEALDYFVGCQTNQDITSMTRLETNPDAVGIISTFYMTVYSYVSIYTIPTVTLDKSNGKILDIKADRLYLDISNKNNGFEDHLGFAMIDYRKYMDLYKARKFIGNPAFGRSSKLFDDKTFM